MSQHSSSISSSDLKTQTPDSTKNPLRETIAVSAWVILLLAAIDVAVNLVFAYPKDPSKRPVNELAGYFNLGRSIEAKIRKLVGPTDATSGSLATAGWIDDSIIARQPHQPSQGDGLLMTVYGMSFTTHVAEALKLVDDRITVRVFGGPASPANHSYAFYEHDRGGNAKVVMLGVLASSVVGISSDNGMTWRMENPAPFTFPRYNLTSSGPEPVWPQVRTLPQMRQALADRAVWDDLMGEFQAHDDHFDGFLFHQNLLDRSTLVRLIRRGWAQRKIGEARARLHNSKGFTLDSYEIKVLNAMLASFSESVKKDGKIPIVLLINDPGYQDHLFQAVKSTLEDKKIPFVSTHEICPTSNPRFFLPDNHFTPDANRMIARVVLDEIHKRLPEFPARPQAP